VHRHVVIHGRGQWPEETTVEIEAAPKLITRETDEGDVEQTNILPKVTKTRVRKQSFTVKWRDDQQNRLENFHTGTC